MYYSCKRYALKEVIFLYSVVCVSWLMRVALWVLVGVIYSMVELMMHMMSYKIITGAVHNNGLEG